MPTSDLYAQRLLLWQSFKEAAWGTPLAATAKWMGVEPYPTVTPKRAAEVFDEARGSLQPGFLSAILQKGGEFKINGLCTYEDIIFLGHGFFGIVVPAGGPPNYTYTYTGAGTAQPTLQTYTIEFSQSGSYVQAQGCIINKLSLKGEASAPWKYEASGFCKDVDTAVAGSPAALSDRAVEVALMPTTQFWMDPTGAAIGTTAYDGTLTDFSLEMENSVNPVYTAGALTPTHWVSGDKWKATLNIGLLWTANVRTAMNTNVLAGKNMLVRLKSTSGAKVLQADFAGVIGEDPEYFPDKNGAQMVNLKLTGVYDSGASLSTSMVATNTVAAVP